MADKTVDVLAVMDEAQCDAENTYGHDSLQVVELNAARAALKDLIAFNQSLVLNGRQRFNATPEQIALSDAAEAALRAVGGAK